MIDGPYKLPEGWRWVRLGEVASEIQSGFAFRKKGARAGEVLHLRPYNIGNDGELKLDQQFKIPNTALPEHWSYLYPGDVLFNNTNSVELVGKTAIVKNVLQAVFSNHITRIRACLDKCEGEWLALALRTLWQQGFFAQQCNKWVGQAGYNTKMLKKTLIPLPPLNEQRRIVAKVEMIMEQIREARRLRQKACEDTDRLWQAVLADTFPCPGTDLPPNWRWVRLGEICEYKTGIWGPEASDPKLGFPIVRSTEIDGMFIRPEKASIREIPRSRLGAYALKSGDILVNKSSGSPRLVGWPALFEGSKDGRIYLFSNFMLRLRVKESVLMSHFLLYYLHSPIARSIYLGAQDTTSGLRNLRVRDFVNQSIPLAPFNEQQGLITHLERTHKNIKSLMDGQAQFETELQCLEQSILDSAFKGEL